LNGKLPKLSRWLSSILLMAGLLALLGGIGCQGQLPNAAALQLGRELPAEVAAGDEFWVTLTFASPEDGFHAIGLTDLVPAGWHVTVDVAWTEPPAMVAHTPEPEKAVYMWDGPHDAGVEFTASYKVRVPVDTEAGTYTFDGSLEYYIEPHPAPSYEKAIAGDVQVTVSQGL
jgi:hypothetical protein